jgi:uncharacterized protein YlxW (UPF0749 family)
MPWWTWAALVFFVLIVAASAAVTVLSLVRMRRLSATGDLVTVALDDLTRKTEDLERRLEHAEEQAELVERKVTKLNASMEQLSVLTWALGDVAKTVSQMRSAVTLRK